MCEEVEDVADPVDGACPAVDHAGAAGCDSAASSGCCFMYWTVSNQPLTKPCTTFGLSLISLSLASSMVNATFGTTLPKLNSTLPMPFCSMS